MSDVDQNNSEELSSLWTEIIENAVNFRRELHRHPELTWAEHDTTKRIRDRLDALDIPWEPCTGTGTLARLASHAGGKHIALRGDIDALPIHEMSDVPWRSQHHERMHACGHDGHAATLFATAAWLKTCEDALRGPVTLIFQPAEEGGHGARAMIEAGALKGIDEIYGWHNWPAIRKGQAVCPEGPVMSANAIVRIQVLGVGGHASQPEATRDPVLAAAAIVVALQQIVSRRIAPQRAAVVSITSIDAKSASNVIRDEVQLAGGIRAGDDETRDAISQEIERIASHTAEAHGCTVEYEYEPCYGATVNHADASEKFRAALSAELGDHWRDENLPVPIMASEDFSYFLKEIPGAFTLVGAGGDKPDSRHPCHSPRYDFNDGLIPVVVRLYSRLVGAPLPPSEGLA